MSSKDNMERGLFQNLFWLLALISLVAATLVVWIYGTDMIKPSRETAVVRVFKKSSPAVVSISAKPVRQRRVFGSFWERFAGPRANDDLNLGSGIVVDPEGFILTNEHVVTNTSWIQVKLVDGQTVPAEVWGTDPALDLAVLKVDVDLPLPHLKMGRSDDLMIGEQIIVIGNPLGLGHTCTTGIISALHRAARVRNRLYIDLIQVDAAVNPGNSGGPLLNIRGQLIGITSALALAPEAEGIGFAIPIDRARQTVDNLIEYGFVPTSWLGISVEDLRDTAEAFGFPGREGIFISRTEKNGPAKGSLKAGDIIEAWNGEQIRDVEDFVNKARELSVDEQVVFTRFRDGERKDVKVRSTAFPEHLADDWAWWHLGIKVGQAADETMAPGVWIASVAPNSPAQSFGLLPGDLILRVNRDKIESKEDFKKAVVRLRGRKNIFLNGKRDNVTFFITIPFRSGGERW